MLLLDLLCSVGVRQQQLSWLVKSCRGLAPVGSCTQMAEGPRYLEGSAQPVPRKVTTGPACAWHPALMADRHLPKLCITDCLSNADSAPGGKILADAGIQQRQGCIAGCCGLTQLPMHDCIRLAEGCWASGAGSMDVFGNHGPAAMQH